MKWKTFAAIVLAATSATACAQSAIPATSSSLTDSAPSNLSRVYIDHKCSFRAREVPGQTFNDDSYMFYANEATNPNGWGFPIGCKFGIFQDEINIQLDVKQVNGQWIWIGTNQPFEKGQHFRAYSMTGKNWVGRGDTYDEITGDEATRQRFLNFCLIQNNGPQVLCVNAQVMNLSDPKSNVLDRILAVLKTIEFVDPPTINPASTSSH